MNSSEFRPTIQSSSPPHFTTNWKRLASPPLNFSATSRDFELSLPSSNTRCDSFVSIHPLGHFLARIEVWSSPKRVAPELMLWISHSDIPGVSPDRQIVCIAKRLVESPRSRALVGAALSAAAVHPLFSNHNMLIIRVPSDSALGDGKDESFSTFWLEKRGVQSVSNTSSALHTIAPSLEPRISATPFAFPNADAQRESFAINPLSSMPPAKPRTLPENEKQNENCNASSATQFDALNTGCFPISQAGIIPPIVPLEIWTSQSKYPVQFAAGKPFSKGTDVVISSRQQLHRSSVITASLSDQVDTIARLCAADAPRSDSPLPSNSFEVIALSAAQAAAAAANNLLNGHFPPYVPPPLSTRSLEGGTRAIEKMNQATTRRAQNVICRTFAASQHHGQIAPPLLDSRTPNRRVKRAAGKPHRSASIIGIEARQAQYKSTDTDRRLVADDQLAGASTDETTASYTYQALSAAGSNQGEQEQQDKREAQTTLWRQDLRNPLHYDDSSDNFPYWRDGRNAPYCAQIGRFYANRRWQHLPHKHQQQQWQMSTDSAYRAQPINFCGTSVHPRGKVGIQSRTDGANTRFSMSTYTSSSSTKATVDASPQKTEFAGDSFFCSATNTSPKNSYLRRSSQRQVQQKPTQSSEGTNGEDVTDNNRATRSGKVHAWTQAPNGDNLDFSSSVLENPSLPLLSYLHRKKERQKRFERRLQILGKADFSPRQRCAFENLFSLWSNQLDASAGQAVDKLLDSLFAVVQLDVQLNSRKNATVQLPSAGLVQPLKRISGAIAVTEKEKVRRCSKNSAGRCSSVTEQDSPAVCGRQAVNRSDRIEKKVDFTEDCACSCATQRGFNATAAATHMRSAAHLASASESAAAMVKDRGKHSRKDRKGRTSVELAATAAATASSGASKAAIDLFECSEHTQKDGKNCGRRARQRTEAAATTTQPREAKQFRSESLQSCSPEFLDYLSVCSCAHSTVSYGTFRSRSPSCMCQAIYAVDSSQRKGQFSVLGELPTAAVAHTREATSAAVLAKATRDPLNKSYFDVFSKCFLSEQVFQSSSNLRRNAVRRPILCLYQGNTLRILPYQEKVTYGYLSALLIRNQLSSMYDSGLRCLLTNQENSPFFKYTKHERQLWECRRCGKWEQQPQRRYYSSCLWTKSNINCNFCENESSCVFTHECDCKNNIYCCIAHCPSGGKAKVINGGELFCPVCSYLSVLRLFAFIFMMIFLYERSALCCPVLYMPLMSWRYWVHDIGRRVLLSFEIDMEKLQRSMLENISAEKSCKFRAAVALVESLRLRQLSCTELITLSSFRAWHKVDGFRCGISAIVAPTQRSADALAVMAVFIMDSANAAERFLSMQNYGEDKILNEKDKLFVSLSPFVSEVTCFAAGIEWLTGNIDREVNSLSTAKHMTHSTLRYTWRRMRSSKLRKKGCCLFKRVVVKAFAFAVHKFIDVFVDVLSLLKCVNFRKSKSSRAAIIFRKLRRVLSARANGSTMTRSLLFWICCSFTLRSLFSFVRLLCHWVRFPVSSSWSSFCSYSAGLKPTCHLTCWCGCFRAHPHYYRHIYTRSAFLPIFIALNSKNRDAAAPIAAASERTPPVYISVEQEYQGCVPDWIAPAFLKVYREDSTRQSSRDQGGRKRSIIRVSSNCKQLPGKLCFCESPFLFPQEPPHAQQHTRYGCGDAWWEVASDASSLAQEEIDYEDFHVGSRRASVSQDIADPCDVQCAAAFFKRMSLASPSATLGSASVEEDCRFVNDAVSTEISPQLSVNKTNLLPANLESGVHTGFVPSWAADCTNASAFFASSVVVVTGDRSRNGDDLPPHTTSPAASVNLVPDAPLLSGVKFDSHDAASVSAAAVAGVTYECLVSDAACEPAAASVAAAVVSATTAEAFKRAIDGTAAASSAILCATQSSIGAAAPVGTPVAAAGVEQSSVALRNFSTEARHSLFLFSRSKGGSITAATKSRQKTKKSPTRFKGAPELLVAAAAGSALPNAAGVKAGSHAEKPELNETVSYLTKKKAPVPLPKNVPVSPSSQTAPTIATAAHAIAAAAAEHKTTPKAAAQEAAPGITTAHKISTAAAALSVKRAPAIANQTTLKRLLSKRTGQELRARAPLAQLVAKGATDTVSIAKVNARERRASANPVEHAAAVLIALKRRLRRAEAAASSVTREGSSGQYESDETAVRTKNTSAVIRGCSGRTSSDSKSENKHLPTEPVSPLLSAKLSLPQVNVIAEDGSIDGATETKLSDRERVKEQGINLQDVTHDWRRRRSSITSSRGDSVEFADIHKLIDQSSKQDEGCKFVQEDLPPCSEDAALSRSTAELSDSDASAPARSGRSSLLHSTRTTRNPPMQSKLSIIMLDEEEQEGKALSSVQYVGSAASTSSAAAGTVPLTRITNSKAEVSGIGRSSGFNTSTGDLLKGMSAEPPSVPAKAFQIKKKSAETTALASPGTSSKVSGGGSRRISSTNKSEERYSSTGKKHPCGQTPTAHPLFDPRTALQIDERKSTGHFLSCADSPNYHHKLNSTVAASRGRSPTSRPTKRAAAQAESEAAPAGAVASEFKAESGDWRGSGSLNRKIPKSKCPTGMRSSPIRDRNMHSTDTADVLQRALWETETALKRHRGQSAEENVKSSSRSVWRQQQQQQEEEGLSLLLLRSGLRQNRTARDTGKATSIFKVEGRRASNEGTAGKEVNSDLASLVEKVYTRTVRLSLEQLAAKADLALEGSVEAVLETTFKSTAALLYEKGQLCEDVGVGKRERKSSNSTGRSKVVDRDPAVNEKVSAAVAQCLTLQQRMKDDVIRMEEKTSLSELTTEAQTMRSARTHDLQQHQQGLQNTRTFHNEFSDTLATAASTPAVNQSGQPQQQQQQQASWMSLGVLKNRLKSFAPSERKAAYDELLTLVSESLHQRQQQESADNNRIMGSPYSERVQAMQRRIESRRILEQLRTICCTDVSGGLATDDSKKDVFNSDRSVDMMGLTLVVTRFGEEANKRIIAFKESTPKATTHKNKPQSEVCVTLQENGPKIVSVRQAFSKEVVATQRALLQQRQQHRQSQQQKDRTSDDADACKGMPFSEISSVKHLPAVGRKENVATRIFKHQQQLVQDLSLPKQKAAHKVEEKIGGGPNRKAINRIEAHEQYPLRRASSFSTGAYQPSLLELVKATRGPPQHTDIIVAPIVELGSSGTAGADAHPYSVLHRAQPDAVYSPTLPTILESGSPASHGGRRSAAAAVVPAAADTSTAKGSKNDTQNETCSDPLYFENVVVGERYTTHAAAERWPATCKEGPHEAAATKAFAPTAARAVGEATMFSKSVSDDCLTTTREDEHSTNASALLLLAEHNMSRRTPTSRHCYKDAVVKEKSHVGQLQSSQDHSAGVGADISDPRLLQQRQASYFAAHAATAASGVNHERRGTGNTDLSGVSGLTGHRLPTQLKLDIFHEMGREKAAAKERQKQRERAVKQGVISAALLDPNAVRNHVRGRRTSGVWFQYTDEKLHGFKQAKLHAARGAEFLLLDSAPGASAQVKDLRHSMNAMVSPLSRKPAQISSPGARGAEPNRRKASFERKKKGDRDKQRRRQGRANRVDPKRLVSCKLIDPFEFKAPAKKRKPADTDWAKYGRPAPRIRKEQRPQYKKNDSESESLDVIDRALDRVYQIIVGSPSESQSQRKNVEKEPASQNMPALQSSEAEKRTLLDTALRVPQDAVTYMKEAYAQDVSAKPPAEKAAGAFETSLKRKGSRNAAPLILIRSASSSQGQLVHSFEKTKKLLVPRSARALAEQVRENPAFTKLGRPPQRRENARSFPHSRKSSIPKILYSSGNERTRSLSKDRFPTREEIREKMSLKKLDLSKVHNKHEDAPVPTLSVDEIESLDGLSDLDMIEDLECNNQPAISMSDGLIQPAYSNEKEEDALRMVKKSLPATERREPNFLPTLLVRREFGVPANEQQHEKEAAENKAAGFCHRFSHDKFAVISKIMPDIANLASPCAPDSSVQISTHIAAQEVHKERATTARNHKTFTVDKSVTQPNSARKMLKQAAQDVQRGDWAFAVVGRAVTSKVREKAEREGQALDNNKAAQYIQRFWRRKSIRRKQCHIASAEVKDAKKAVCLKRKSAQATLEKSSVENTVATPVARSTELLNNSVLSHDIEAKSKKRYHEVSSAFSQGSANTPVQPSYGDSTPGEEAKKHAICDVATLPSNSKETLWSVLQELYKDPVKVKDGFICIPLATFENVGREQSARIGKTTPASPALRKLPTYTGVKGNFDELWHMWLERRAHHDPTVCGTEFLDVERSVKYKSRSAEDVQERLLIKNNASQLGKPSTYRVRLRNAGEMDSCPQLLETCTSDIMLQNMNCRDLRYDVFKLGDERDSFSDVLGSPHKKTFKPNCTSENSSENWPPTALQTATSNSFTDRRAVTPYPDGVQGSFLSNNMEWSSYDYPYRNGFDILWNSLKRNAYISGG